MKNLLTSIALVALASCSALGIGGEPVTVTASDHETLDKFLEYATAQGAGKVHEFLDQETALAVGLRLWKVAVISSGDPDGIFLPKPE